MIKRWTRKNRFREGQWRKVGEQARVHSRSYTEEAHKCVHRGALTQWRERTGYWYTASPCRSNGGNWISGIRMQLNKCGWVYLHKWVPGNHLYLCRYTHLYTGFFFFFWRFEVMSPPNMGLIPEIKSSTDWASQALLYCYFKCIPIHKKNPVRNLVRTTIKQIPSPFLSYKCRFSYVSFVRNI